MSSRQVRRLQDLVDRATGLDASNEDETALAMPSTMQTKTSVDRHHAKRKIKREKKRTATTATTTITAKEEETIAAEVPFGPSTMKVKNSDKQTSPNATAATATVVSSPTTDDWEEVEDAEGNDDNTRRKPVSEERVPHRNKNVNVTEESEAAPHAGAHAEEEKKRKKEERRRQRRQQRRQQQAEEDALLDAVLAHQVGPHNTAEFVSGHHHRHLQSNSGNNSALASPNTAGRSPTNSRQTSEMYPSGDTSSSLLHFVMACDARQLDTRLERIRMFGADAVEDVGDGRTPHRRADGRVRDTGSISFFTEHHMHVKFLHSAFATPNRYRWVPYDSLGVYLTTEEGHGTQGQTWRDYTLNCDSNAFQRALAQLSACQNRMGGVPDLVECLARSKVYHIPTLLQCIYAMEATGESAIAGELLDVALYQVGVILRRFALSGTWTQRRLPMNRGGNALIFQVLQRGVHSALKRGCLRTAFERTRCLLSLDQRDPCGMLLLLDYTALRAKRWVWLLEMRHRVRTSAGNTQDSSLECSIKALPNYAFSWALAKHFIEREERLQSANGGGNGSDGRPSRVLRGLTDTQREALASTPAAEELLTFALVRFPHAAMRLVNALGGVETVCGNHDNNPSYDDLVISDRSVWCSDIMRRAKDATSGDALQQSRLAELFVSRHEELWKLNECISLLRTAVRALVCAPTATTMTMFSQDSPASPITRNSSLLDPYAYLDLTREAVLGVTVAPIPADLLRPDVADLALDGGAGEDGNVFQVDRAVAEEVLRMLRQNIEDGVEDEATQRYLQQLEAELGERLRRGAQHIDVDAGRDALHNNNNGNNAAEEAAAAEELDWYDYNDEEIEDVEAQEWYSVASDEDVSVERERRGDPQ